MSERCAYRVFSGKRYDFGGHLCGKPAKTQDDDGKWKCAIHTKAAIEKRKHKQDERYAEENKAQRERYAKEAEERRRARCFPGMLEALEAMRSFMWSEGYADQTAVMAQADAAIRVATGDAKETEEA